MSENGHINTPDQLFAHKYAPEVIERDVPGVGRMRFKTLSAEALLRLGTDGVGLVIASVCDENGHSYLTEEHRGELTGPDFPGNALNHMLRIVNQHCVPDPEEAQDTAAGN